MLLVSLSSAIDFSKALLRVASKLRTNFNAFDIQLVFISQEIGIYVRVLRSIVRGRSEIQFAQCDNYDDAARPSPPQSIGLGARASSGGGGVITYAKVPASESLG